MRKHIMYIVALTSMAVALFGCKGVRYTGAMQYVGIYIKNGSPSDSTELMSNGSFVVSEEGIKVYGDYRIDGANISLVSPKNGTALAHIEDDKIIDNENNIWLKTKP